MLLWNSYNADVRKVNEGRSILQLRPGGKQRSRRSLRRDIGKEPRRLTINCEMHRGGDEDKRGTLRLVDTLLTETDTQKKETALQRVDTTMQKEWNPLQKKHDH